MMAPFRQSNQWHDRQPVAVRRVCARVSVGMYAFVCVHARENVRTATYEITYARVCTLPASIRDLHSFGVGHLNSWHVPIDECVLAYPESVVATIDRLEAARAECIPLPWPRG